MTSLGKCVIHKLSKIQSRIKLYYLYYDSIVERYYSRQR